MLIATITLLHLGRDLFQCLDAVSRTSGVKTHLAEPVKRFRFHPLIDEGDDLWLWRWFHTLMPVDGIHRFRRAEICNEVNDAQLGGGVKGFPMMQHTQLAHRFGRPVAKKRFAAKAVGIELAWKLLPQRSLLQ